MTRDYPDYSRVVVPSQRMGQSWAPHWYFAFEDNIPAATAYSYDLEYPDDDFVYTLVCLSGWFNSLEPMQTELFVNDVIVMTQRKPAGWYKQFIRGALLRMSYPDKLVFTAYNHRDVELQLVATFTHYKELG